MEKNGASMEANKRAEEAIKEYARDGSKENLVKMVNLLRPTGLLVPARIDEDKKPIPFFLRNNQGEQFLAVFTGSEHANEETKKQSVVRMPFPMCNSIVANDRFDLKGMVINPYTDNLILKKALIVKLYDADRELAEQIKSNRANMSPQEYIKLLRKQVEFQILPKRLFAEGEDFVNRLCQEKEDVIVELFEELAKEAKLHPYSKSDFSLMALNISPQLQLIRLDMPANGAGLPSCQRVYLTFNPETKQAGYYTVEQLPNVKERHLGSMDANGVHQDLGEAPVEGAELERIMALAQEHA